MRGGLRIALPLLVTAGLLAAGDSVLNRAAESRALLEAEDRAGKVEDVALHRLPAAAGVMQYVERFFAASSEVTRQEFVTFVATALRQPGVAAIEWLPRVTRAERAAFEAAARRDGLDDFQIVERASDGRMVRAGERAEYFPVRFGETAPGNSHLSGFDRMPIPRHRAAMERAATSGAAAATAPQLLVRSGRHGVIVFLPVYLPGFDAAAAAPEARRAALRGFAVGVFDIEALLAPLARAAQAEHLVWRLTDVTPGAPVQILADTLVAGGHPVRSRELDFSGRVWRLETQAAGPVWRETAKRDAGLFMAFSVFAALLVGFAVLAAAGRHTAISGSERRFRTLTQNLNGMVYRCRNDADWTMEFASDGCRALLGIEPAALTAGRPSYGSLIHPDDSALVWRTVQDGIGGRRRFQIEYRVRHADGDWRWVLEQGVGIVDDDGTLQYLEGFITDVSEHKRAELALSDSQHLVAATLDSLSAHIAILNANGVIIATNRTWRDFAAANSADSQRLGIGENYLAVCDRAAAEGDADAARTARGIRAVMAGQRSDWSFEYPCHSPAENRWFYCRVTRFAGSGPLHLVVAHENITSIRRAQADVLESERRFRATFEHAGVGIVTVARNGCIEQCNQVFAALLEETGEALAGRSLVDFFHPEDRDLDAVQVEQVWRGEIPAYSHEKRLLSEQGQALWVMQTCSVVLDAGGAPLYYVKVFANISARKRLEEAQHALNTLLSGDAFFAHVAATLARVLGADVAFVSESSRSTVRTRALYIDGEQAAAKEYAVAGSPAEKIIGQRFCLFPDRVQQLFPEARHMAGTGVVAYAANPLWDSQHRPLGMIGVASRTPITDAAGVEGVLQLLSLAVAAELERERERALLEARIAERTRDLQAANELIGAREMELRSVLDNLVDCVLTIDARGIVQSANPAVERVLGYAADEVIGQNVSLLAAEPHRSRHDDYLRHYVETGEARIIGIGREVEGRHKDGRIIPLELAVNEYRAHGERFFIGTLRDVSERQRITRELRDARDAAEAANRAKSAFLATMSHEIRTPMNGVLGTMEVLRRASLTPYQTELVDTIGESAVSLLTLIDDILDFSKIEAGRLELEREPLSLAALVESVCDALQPVAARKQVDLAIYTDPGLPDWILGDSLRLRQILNNLLSNAIKFSAREDARGRVRVRAVAAGADGVQLTVSDNGIGMAPATLEKLFTPFTQAESSTTRRFGGSGLGLVICRRLVELMGGRIGVESTPEQGARFTVVLPVTADTAQPPLALGPDLAGLACFIVAREADLGQDWAAYLRHAGAETQISPDLDTARRQILSSPAAAKVLIVDKLPQGLALAGLRASPNTQPGPGVVVIASGKRRRPRRIADGNGGTVLLDGDSLRRAALLQAVALAAGRVSAAEEEAAPASSLPVDVVPPSTDEAAAAGRLILVAEDNDINRKVIRRQLALLGHAAEIADDGRKAFALWRTGRHALLLTDLHMPEMDGYELTAAIRSEEGEGRHLPIVALTANAMKGEELRCREAGMDGYLSKPVQLDPLQAMLERWLPPGSPPQNREIPQAFGDAATDNGPAVLDTAVLAKLVGDDPALIAEFLDDYRHSAQQAAGEIRSALAGHDWRTAAAAAHKLKSSSRSVGALGLGEVCARLEKAGNDGAAEMMDALAGEFENTLAAVIRAIEQEKR